MFSFADNTLIPLAAAFAEYHHGGQMRRGNSEPYFNHVKRVAESVAKMGGSVEAIAAAYLHDVVEDTNVSFDELRGAGFPLRTVDLVWLLTKRKPEETYESYIHRLLNNGDREALLIKLADLNDNSNIDYRYLWNGWQDAQRRYTEAKIKIVDKLINLEEDE